MGFGGKGGSQTVVNKTEVDPKDRAYLDQYRKMVSGYGNRLTRGGPITAGMDPASRYAGQQLYGFDQLNPIQQQALAGYGGLYNMGFTPEGLNTDAFFNPFQDQVIGGVQSDYDRQRQMAARQSGDLATQAGAFGGSRSAVLQGEALRDINMDEAQQLANLRYSGYGDAQRMAMQLGLTGLQGLGGFGNLQKMLEGQKIQGLLGFGDYSRGVNQEQMRDELLRNQLAQGMHQSGIMFPGQTSTQTQQSQMGWLPGLLGIGSAAAGLGLPGAIAGLFGGGGQAPQYNPMSLGGVSPYQAWGWV